MTTTTAYKDFPYNLLEGRIIYTTLSCENNAGLSFIKSSNGVKVSNTPPSTSTAQIEIVPLSPTEYTLRDGYHGLSDNMRLKWSGFTDTIGIETFDVSIN